MTNLNVWKQQLSTKVLLGLPEYITNSELFTGKVEVTSKFLTATPGMQTYNTPATPSFARAMIALSEEEATVGWNSETAVAEMTCNGFLYSAAYSGRNVTVMKSGGALNAQEEVPAELIFLLSMGFLLEDEEFTSQWEVFRKASDDETKVTALATLYSNAYARKAQNAIAEAAANKPLQALNPTKATAPKYNPVTQMGGEFKYFANADGGSAPAAANVSIEEIHYGNSYNGKFQLVPKDTLSKEQLEHVLEMDETMVISPDAIEACEMIIATKDSINPVRNILETGLPGTGKTEMAKQIAAMLGVPFYFTQLFDLFSGEDAKGTFQPSASNGKTIANLPTAEDVVFDTANAYFALTGQTKTEATVEEVQKLRDEAIRASSDAAKIVFVPGVIEHAAEPCVIFIDEITSPKNPAAITVFNSLLDRSSRITLTDNRVIHRHKNCIIVAAGNFSDDGVEMDGFRDPNRSFLDRFDEVIHLEQLAPEMVKAMLLANNPSWSEEDKQEVPVDTFVSILPELRAICQNHGDMCEFRAINAWFRKSLILRDPIRAAQKTVIGISTRQRACADAMMAKIVSRFQRFSAVRGGQSDVA